jgi:hypothetical protein
MSYRLKALAPCTIAISGASYRVEAGDPLHLSDADAQQILAGPYRAKFAIISQDDPEDAVSISEQSQDPNPAFFSNGTLPMVRSDDLHAPKPEYKAEVKASSELPPLGAVTDEVVDLYAEEKKDGEAFLEAVNKAQEVQKKPARKRASTKPFIEKPIELTEEKE